MAQIQTKFIANNAVTNAKLAQLPANTLKGNNTGSSANAADLTIAQVQAMLSIPTSSSPLSIAAGGTGQITQQAALNALAGAVTSGFYLRGNGTNVVMSTIQVGDVPTLNQNTTGTAANITATSNSTLTTLSALTTASSLSSVGTITSGTWNGTTIAIANGGTGQTSAAAAFAALSPLTTAGDLIYENATPAPARLAIGSSGQVLTVVSGLPAWATPTTGTVSTVSVASANGFAGTVATPTSTPVITIETTINSPVLAGNGTALIAATTTGTGSTVVLSASPTFTGTVTTAALSATTGSFSGAVNMTGNQINDLANGTASTDAVNLGQLQAAIAGLYWQGPAQAYAASNVPLTGGATLTIDGYSVQNGDLVILGNQTIASQNGEYTASGIGTAYVLTANGLPTAAGDAWLILNGTVYGDSAFVANAAVPAATFTEFAGPTAYTFTAPLSLSGRTVSITQATTSTNGYLSSTDWNTFNNKQPAGNYITALTGDGTASGPGSASFTLATVNSDVGSYGSASSVAAFTVNGKGLVTAASSVSIQIAESQVTNLVSDLAGKQATGNYITALTGDVTASGPGSATATVNSVGGATAADIAAVTAAYLSPSGGPWADQALNNLTSPTAVNQDLLPGSTQNLGNVSSPWNTITATNFYTSTTNASGAYVNVGPYATNTNSGLYGGDITIADVGAAITMQSVGSAFFGMFASQGTIAVPTASQSSDGLGTISWGGFGATNFGYSAAINAYATENFTDSTQGTQLTFSTTPNGSTNLQVTWTMDQDGGLKSGPSGSLWLTDSTTNTVSIYANPTTTTYSLTLPATQGAGALTNDGSGNLSWVAGVGTATEDILTLSSGDITAQYKDLNYPVTGYSATVNSISLSVVGGPEQLKGVDYTVSLTGGVGGVTRITFAGDLASGGGAALVAGDILMVEYTTDSNVTL
jgi:hypothetical protein